MCSMGGATGVMGGMDMMGSMMIGMLFVLAVVIALAVAGGVWLGRSLARRDDNVPQVAEDPAQVELRRRYAAGEIDREEYLQRKIDME
ncbi:hypothetical protein CDO52_01540 [Nocardiopsis gilva YIM 90087]|uniref:SHOCT domain-containing protein n=1 Tax=Nocardiopsis gilva YIM 90087 TaxID=1235441 RepID=A0A223S0I5_9ACTN|nr:SHOCT domain-containing protein [Nocardiopsis gilva]ASU81652.1 hypothetical protein CDO52_01540 [Nocardiopsis gilva YIM 90087]